MKVKLYLTVEGQSTSKYKLGLNYGNGHSKLIALKSFKTVIYLQLCLKPF